MAGMTPEEARRRLKDRDTYPTDAQKRAYQTILNIGKVAGLLDLMAGDMGRLADSSSDEYAKGKQDAYALAAEIIRETLGETNE